MSSVRQQFKVSGMSCAGCAARVQDTLGKQEGVTSAAVNLANNTATVEYDAAVSGFESLQRAVQAAGYDLVQDGGPEVMVAWEEKQAQERRQLLRRAVSALAVSVLIMLVNMLLPSNLYTQLVQWALASFVLFYCGLPFFVTAWRQLRHGTANMDTLVAGSTGTAYLFSLFNMLFPSVWLSRGITPHLYFESAAMIIGFILLGRYLENLAKGRANASIQKLKGLQAQTVCVCRADGRTEEVPLRSVQVGDEVLVRSGERIAVDGRVLEGESSVDESTITGEAVPAPKTVGSTLYAGTVNQKGSLRMQAVKVGQDTVLSQIIRLVEDAQGSKAPVQRLVDKVAAVFVPVVIGIALLAFVLWMVLGGGFTHALLAFVTVLIIACPCALGLATPTALMVGMGKGAENGILIKDAESLEVAKEVNAVVFDKTGTLTEGHPAVQACHWFVAADEQSQAEGILCGLESASTHPLSEAVCTYLSTTALPVTSCQSVVGMGISGQYAGQDYWAGNDALLHREGVEPTAEMREAAARLQSEGQTLVWFFTQARVLALLGISDVLRPSAASAVAQLRKEGITSYLLTGDQLQAAAPVAHAAGIDSYRASLLPQDKVTFIKSLQQNGRKVAMVGDGINDSAALAQADISIAMGSGSDIAMEAAGITIVGGDLNKIASAVRLSRATLRTIRQNLFWAFVYNVVSIPVAAGILYPVCGFLLNPMIGALCMAFSSVSVVTNSLRLRRQKI